MGFYNCKCHADDQGDAFVVESGGQIRINDGGAIIGASGSQNAAIDDVDTGSSADADANATAINSILATLRDVGIIATS